MELNFKCADLRRGYQIKTGISFEVQDCREINNRVVTIFFYKDVPIISTYIDVDTLNIHGFAYKDQQLCKSTIELTKEITNKIKNMVVFEVFESI